MSWLARISLALASPLRRLDIRSTKFEEYLGLTLDEGDVDRIRSSGDGVRIGAYYHWYLQKKVVAQAIKQLEREPAIRFLNAADRTDYRQAKLILDCPTGVLIAIPHHSHYILSMTALAAHLGKHRKVKVFYGQPATHKGNEVFDHLHEVLFSDPACNVEVIHDDRQGLAKAIKGLKSGDIVFIMPDAFQNEDATLMFPFCERLMSSMLGTAVLARKTGSCVLPVLSKTDVHGLGFSTWFGDPIEHLLSDGAGLTAEQTKLADYGLMRRVYEQLEEQMLPELYQWQHVRGHLANAPKSNLVEQGALAALADSIANHSIFKPAPVVVDLR